MQAIHMVRPRTNILLGQPDLYSILEQYRALYGAIAQCDPKEAAVAFDNHVSHLADLRQEAARPKRKDVRAIPRSELVSD